MYNLWDNGCESYVYKPCVAHGKGMVYMSPIVTPQSHMMYVINLIMISRVYF